MKKSRLLKGKSKEFAERIHRIHGEAQRRTQTIEADYRERMKAANDEMRADLQAQFEGLFDAEGISREELALWAVDSQYVDHGLFFLVPAENSDAGGGNPLADMFQAATSVRH